MSILLRSSNGDKISKIYGSYLTPAEIKNLKVGSRLDVLCSDGLNYHAEISAIGKVNSRTAAVAPGVLHFLHWSRAYDYKGDFAKLYLAPLGRYSEGISLRNTYPDVHEIRERKSSRGSNNGGKRATSSEDEDGDEKSENDFVKSGTSNQTYPAGFLDKPRLSLRGKRAISVLMSEEFSSTIGDTKTIALVNKRPIANKNSHDPEKKRATLPAAAYNNTTVGSWSEFHSELTSDYNGRLQSERKQEDSSSGFLDSEKNIFNHRLVYYSLSGIPRPQVQADAPVPTLSVPLMHRKSPPVDVPLTHVALNMQNSSKQELEIASLSKSLRDVLMDGKLLRELEFLKATCLLDELTKMKHQVDSLEIPSASSTENIVTSTGSAGHAELKALLHERKQIDQKIATYFDKEKANSK